MTDANFSTSPSPGDGFPPSPAAAEAYRQGHELFVRADRSKDEAQRRDLYRQAAGHFSRAVELQPDHSPACNYGAMCLRRLAGLAEDGQKEALYGQAAEIYVRAAALQPENGHVQRNWGRTLVDLSALRDDPAESAALRRQAADCFAMAVKLDPADAVSYSYWGCTLEVLAEDFAGPDAPAVIDRLRREALEKLETATGLDPELEDAWYHAAAVLRGLAEDERDGAQCAALETRACECLVTALALYPRWGNAERALGQALSARAELTQDAVERAGLAGEADVHFAAAVGLEPAWPGHLHHWGAALCNLGLATADVVESARLVRQAIAKFEAALELAPGFQSARLGLANALIKIAHLADPAEAGAPLDRAIGLFERLDGWRPEDSAGNFRWAEALRLKAGLAADAEEKVRLLREAGARFAAAAEYFPASFLVHEERGLTLLRLFRALPPGPEDAGLMAQVRESLQRAAGLAPRRAEPLIHLAGTFEEEARRGADRERTAKLLGEGARFRGLAAQVEPDEPSNLILWSHNLLRQAHLADEAGERERCDDLLDEAAAKGALTVRAKPEWREAWTTWGRALFGRAAEHFDLGERQRLLKMARQKFTRAAGMGSLEGVFRLARLEASEGDVPATVKALEQWRELEPRAERKLVEDCPDFRSLAGHPVFVAFVDSLPVLRDGS